MIGASSYVNATGYYKPTKMLSDLRWAKGHQGNRSQGMTNCVLITKHDFLHILETFCITVLILPIILNCFIILYNISVTVNGNGTGIILLPCRQVL